MPLPPPDPATTPLPTGYDWGIATRMTDNPYMMTAQAMISDAQLAETGCKFERDVPLGSLTWYGIGGSAAVLAHPATAEQFASLVRLCHHAELPLRVLGKGANLLVCDGVVEGVVVRLDRMKATHIESPSGYVTAQAGADLEKLITATVRDGLAGLEVLAGIPATIGGALCMNAGGAFGSIGPCVEQVTIIEADGTIAQLDRAHLQFSYRSSNLTDRYIVAATFALTPSPDPAALRERLKEVMEYKKHSQPMAANSAGCAFKNPHGQSEKGAGKLIDEAGLKGFGIGGAEVSPVHANFITLRPDGAANDVLAVMKHVQQVVEEKFGVQLQREVVIWGDAC